ncbi:MAG: hypothetical protein IKE69_05590 [Thermoguttaceae bacterium]|nr:hypothetical protein [Thermoguttaceae bacterium]
MKTPVQEANSLEKLLISTGDYLKENREKCLQTLLLILVAVAAVVFLRTYFYGKPKKFQQDFDQAYAISSQQAMLTGLPSVEPYDTLAAHYNRGDAGAEIRINAAEAVLKTGQNQVERKKAASRAGRAAADVIAMDPEATFNDAIKRFEEVTSPQMAVDRGLAARALYGLASAWENLAAVTAGDDEVNVKLDTAKGGYQRVIGEFAETPYAAQAKIRLAKVDEPLTREFYKKSAADYVAMPVPEEIKPEESILPEGSDQLDPAADVTGEDFSLEGDEVEATAEPAPEAEPAAEAPAEAPAEPAAEPAAETPAEPAAEATAEPAAEAPAESE